jgi:5-methyltetrahydrofolate corrinoid/iron sulfur protein methyltransferase
MLIVADNLSIVDPQIARAVAGFDPAPIQDLVRRCEAAGAQAIDINSGPLPRKPVERFKFLVEAVQAVTDLPLILDSTNPLALEAGLAACRRPAIINGFSLEPAKLEHILPLARRFGADIVGYLLYPDSRVPMVDEELMGLAVELFAAYCESGLPPERLIIDPVVAPLSWDNGLRRNRALLAVLQKLPELLGTRVRTIAGLSNLTTGPTAAVRKSAVETVFLPMLAAAGLDIVLLNVFHRATMAAARTCNQLLSDGVFSWASVSI